MSTIATRRLDCGMPLIVETMSGVRSAAISWLIPAGTAAEPADRQGMSTMCAELLMRGCGTLDSRQHADALDRLGVARSTDASGPHVRVSATMVGDRLSAALPLIVDMVRRPLFEPAAIDPARDLALQALDALKDDPQDRAVTSAKLRHFPEPHNRSTRGTEDGLNAVTRDDVARFWSARARPGGSILGVAGAVDPDAITAQLNTLLAGWSGDAPEPAHGAAPPRGYAHAPDETNQVQIVVMADAPREHESASLMEKVAVSVLSGGMAGRLFTEVREKRGLCYAVSASYGAGKQFGSVLGYVGTTPERAQESLDVLLLEMDRINRPGGEVTAEELSRAVIGMKSRLVFSGESSAARAAAIASDVYRLGRARSLEEMASEIDRVTIAGVNNYLSTRSMGVLTIQTLGPKELTPPRT